MSQRRSPREYLPNPVHAASERRPVEEYLPNPVHADSERRQSEYFYKQEGSLQPFSNFDGSADNEDQWINDDDDDRAKKMVSYKNTALKFDNVAKRQTLLRRDCRKKNFYLFLVKEIDITFKHIIFKMVKSARLFYTYISKLYLLESEILREIRLLPKWHHFFKMVVEADFE
ncbi:unnamed protein product, partial [Meganyctiphanes norvegica]